MLANSLGMLPEKPFEELVQETVNVGARECSQVERRELLHRVELPWESAAEHIATEITASS